jgi:hypothetical protein
LDAQGQGQVQLPDVGTLQRPREALVFHERACNEYVQLLIQR